MKGTFFTVYSYLGFEILLVVGPYMRSPDRVKWSLFASIGTVTLIYFFIVVMVFATLGLENTKILLWPTMSLVRTLTAPGGIFERLDAPALALWTIAAYTTNTSLFFAGALAIAHFFAFKEFKPFTTALFPWIYLMAIIPPNLLYVFEWANISGYFGIVICVVIPGFILLLSKIKRGRSRESNRAHS